MKKALQNEVFIGAALSLIAFAVYLSTLAPTVGSRDSGELAAVAATLGIAHPSGYPLFTLLGWVFTHLPFGGRVIWKLNLLAALFCSSAVFFFYRAFQSLLSEKKKTGSSTAERMAAAVAALVLAFSETYWTQALSVEVYSLHILFLSLLLWLFVHALQEKSTRSESGSNRAWNAFAFVLGLSFTNHLTTILLAPGCLYLFFATNGFGRSSWIQIGKAAIPFLLGLSLYLYLPLRALGTPLMNWGNPDTFAGFWRHITVGDYRGYMFSSLGVATRQLNLFLNGFLREFGYAPLPFALIGLVSLYRQNRKILIFSALLFVGCVVYSVNYAADSNSYFQLAYVATALWIAFGIRVFLGYFRNGATRWLAPAVCVLLVLLPIGIHYSAVDESHDRAVEEYARNMLEPLEPNAVIVSTQWECFTSAAYYLQVVEGVRPDVIVVDQNLLMHSWYYVQLERRHPGFLRNSQSQIDSLLQELVKFEHHQEFDSVALGARFLHTIRSLVVESSKIRPVYLTPELVSEVVSEFEYVPDGLAYRIFRDTLIKPASPKEFVFHPFPRSNPQIEDIKSYYAAAYVNQGNYWAEQGDSATANQLLRMAAVIKPDLSNVATWVEPPQEGH